jgi:hypothetical protein
MALDVESHWKNLLNKGLKFTAIGVASAFIFAVANKLADNAVTNVVDGFLP